MMKFVSIAYIGFKSLISYVLDCFRISLHSLDKKVVFRYFNFNSCYGLHTNLKDKVVYKPYGQMSSAIQQQYGGENRQFLPQLKQWVSLPSVL